MPAPPVPATFAPDIPASGVIRDRLRRITVEASLLRRQLRLAERRECEVARLSLDQAGGRADVR